MTNDKHIIDTKCPMCNNTLNEQSIQDKSVKCSYCGYEYPLKSPFDKKRERIIIATNVYISKHSIVCGLLSCAIFLAPLIIYLIVSEQSIVGLYEAHPIGTIIYIFVFLYVLVVYPVSLIFSFALFEMWRKKGYDMNWLIAYQKKHSWAKIAIRSKYFKNEINRSKDL